MRESFLGDREEFMSPGTCSQGPHVPGRRVRLIFLVRWTFVELGGQERAPPPPQAPLLPVGEWAWVWPLRGRI